MEKYTALFEKNNNQNQETISPFSHEKLENELINEALRLHVEDFSNFQSPPQFEILISQHSQEAKKIINDLLLNNIDKWQNEFLKKHNCQFDSEISDYIDSEFDINPYVPLKQSETEEEFSKQRTKELQYSINEDLVTSESLLPFRAFTDFKKEIIKAMGNTKDPDFIPSLINFTIKLGVNAPEYIEIITQSLKNINNPKSISLLLNLAQSTDSIERRIALSILYRLEDKQIGITDEGLLYLQKRFDLGEEYNKEKYFGQRITNAGQIGIFETSSNKLLKYFNIDTFSSDNLASKAKLLDITYSTLFTALPGETLEEKSQREKFLTHFQEIYSDFFHNDFFVENNFHFNDLSFSEQAAFIHLYENYSKEDRHHLEVFSRTFGLSGFRSLLAMSADNDINTGKMVITISKQLAPQAAHQIFTEFNNLIEKTRITSSETFSQLQAEYPNQDIQEEQINYALLARGRDYFKEIYKQLSDNPEQTKAIIKEYSEELRSEKPAVSFFRSEFKTIAELLGRKNINLNSLSSEQSLLLQKISSDEYKEIAFCTLSRIDRLEPIPEIHWRVDRDPEEYNRRLGINVDRILENLQVVSLNEKPKILLEIGPGSGKHKYSRSKKASGYEDYGLSDRIYYPLTPIIEKLLNFDSLEKDISQTLSESDRKKLSDFIYKILVIQKNQTSLDNFSYDDEIQQLLKKDINNLKEILPHIGSRLSNVKAVPETTSSRNDQGEVIYPNKIFIESFSPALQSAKKYLENNFTNYLVDDWEKKDYFSLIDAFPANTMIGDIKDIDRLADNQIDVELAVRSTVYSRHEDYENFLIILVDKLKTGGVALDDSIRDNDGWYYRFAEIIKAREQFKNETEILVILGPGFPGEDYQQERVPLSMIITKEGSSKELIASQLEPNCEVVSFDELTNDEKYLASLDRTGLTYTRTQAAKKINSALAA